VTYIGDDSLVNIQQLGGMCGAAAGHQEEQVPIPPVSQLLLHQTRGVQGSMNK